MTWKIKTDGEQKPVFEEGKPVYLDPDGKELALDPPQMYMKILELGTENKKRREALEAAQANLKLFDGVSNLEEWKRNADAALEHVANFNDKDWLKVEKVDKLKSEMKIAFEDQLATVKKGFTAQAEELQGTIGKKDAQIRKLLISNRFATSPLFSGQDPKTILPPDLAEAYFGKYFDIKENDNGELRIVGHYANGDQVISHRNVGDLADFDEAIESIFEQYPGKDKLLKTKGRGSGGSGGGGGGANDGTPADIRKLEEDYAAAEKAKDAKQMIMIKNRLIKARLQQKAA